jgi:protein gp37
MSIASTIEWTEATWNAIRGCTLLSPGCAHCYAKAFAERFRGVPGHPYEQGFDLRLVPGQLGLPLTWARPRLVFVNSMADLFHKDVPTAYIAAVCQVMREAHWHTFQVLTKREGRMRDLLRGELRWAADLDNVWWGVSVENRKHGLPRVDALRATPARVRFLSVEPLLEDLGEDADLTTGLDWVIVGGESGRRPRPMDADWVRPIRDRCRAAGVPFFFKQWGGRMKKAAGRELDGRTHDDMPARLSRPTPSRSDRTAASNRIAALAASFMSERGQGRTPLPLLDETGPTGRDVGALE